MAVSPEYGSKLYKNDGDKDRKFSDQKSWDFSSDIKLDTRRTEIEQASKQTKN